MHIEQSELCEAQNLKHFSALTDHFFIPLIFDLFICLNDGLSNDIALGGHEFAHLLQIEQ